MRNGRALSVLCNESWGEVVRRTVGPALVCAWMLVASGCGARVPARMPTSPLSVRALPSPTAGDPCAGVITTTPIENVVPACQERWLPYDVSDVPPSNELQIEHVPHAPAVANMTDGAVSDAVAQHWADASNWDSGWWKWAEANDQLLVLRHLVGPTLIPADEVELLQSGGTVEQPDCNLYPITSKLFAVGVAGKAYFIRRHLSTDDAYVFVVEYRGPCSEIVKQGNDQRSTIIDFTENTTVFQPGVFRHDAVLGDLWFADAGGSCEDPMGPPPAWCGR
jgi:hypothetical protein